MSGRGSEGVGAVGGAAERAVAAERAGRMGEAIRAWREAAAADARGVRDAEAVRSLARALERVGQHDAALREIRVFDPSGADRELAAWAARLRDAVEPGVVPARGGDEFGTSIPRAFLRQIQGSLYRVTHRGVAMQKNPFDLAIYQRLLWDLRPRTVFEIGSKAGGSALWFADQIRALGIGGGRVVSVDIVRPEGVRDELVEFLEGDGRALGEVLSGDFLERLPRPWLVIEDADHSYETSVAVGRFFEPLLRAGEFLVLEDGIISDLAPEHYPGHTSGPHRAVRELTAGADASFEIAAGYCDLFGVNVTWASNGYLRRTGGNGSLLVEARSRLASGDAAGAACALHEIKASRVVVRGLDVLRGRCALVSGDRHTAAACAREELRRFPGAEDAALLLSEAGAGGGADDEGAALAAFDDEVREAVGLVRPYSMMGAARLGTLYALAREVCRRGVPGVFAECGVAGGGSLAIMALAASRHGGREVHGFDTFGGMPDPGERDTAQGTPAAATGWGAGTCCGPREEVERVLGSLGLSGAVRLHEGLFEDTLGPFAGALRSAGRGVALLHADGDWYSSTRAIFERLFGLVPEGGAVQIDDYGHWDGCRVAVDECLRESGVTPRLHGIDYTGRYFVRGDGWSL